ncbi:Ras family GTPase [Legionella wadsworthii]|uniref:Ras family GTPase n=1 Tax=Legionella wadsworthii TaxID=28088 RepID=A0A378LWT1_9GAMM|nr:F-box-like domain-containing protein [Legionella wadsworthii]STY31717.1 Ras family GTPase [Legionella wadsworthii]
MNGRITYFQEQINLIKAVYFQLEQYYDYLGGFNPKDSYENQGVNQLLKLKHLLEVHQERLNNLQEMFNELKQKKDDKSAFNTLGAKIGMEVEKLLGDIIDLSCPESSQTALKKQYSTLLAKIFFLLKSEEKSLMIQLTSTLKGSSALKQFNEGLQLYKSELTVAIRQKQTTMERVLPPEMQNELVMIKAGSFGKLPKEISECIASFLEPKDLCRLSATGRFFRKITEAPRANNKNSLLKITVNFIGDSNIGIKSLICRLAENKFNDSNFAHIQKSQVQRDEKYGSILLHYQSPLIQGRDYPMTHNATPYYVKQYNGTKIHLLCFDIGSRESFNNLKSWYQEVFHYNQYNSKFSFLFVGLKGDAQPQRQVSKREAEELAECYGTTYIETSAKNKMGIEPLKLQIVETYMKRNKPLSIKQKEEILFTAKP